MMRVLSLLKNASVVIPAIALGAVGIMFGAAAQSPPQDQVSPVIKAPSSVGEVTFPHKFHFDDLEISCETCHHEVNAARLMMPHKDFFDDFWIDCQICHRGDAAQGLRAQPCSNCHHDSPTNIADETTSAKVVIHKNCWECHEVARGEEGSRSCRTCHLAPSPAVDPK